MISELADGAKLKSCGFVVTLRDGYIDGYWVIGLFGYWEIQKCVTLRDDYIDNSHDCADENGLWFLVFRLSLGVCVDRRVVCSNRVCDCVDMRAVCIIRR